MFIFAVILVATSLVMMSFEPIRRLGASLLASAGVVGLVLGIAAQKSIANVVAGIQIAITQPIRIDDVVVIEGEWGRIEEITLTYVVVSIWDQRRLVVPISYCIEKPFQNWTRNTSEILGTVFLYLDYTCPVEEIRKETTRLLQDCEYWDKRVNVVHVTAVTERSQEVRVLASSADSSSSWELRCYLREKLMDYCREHHPESLVKTRWVGTTTEAIPTVS